MAKYLHFNSPTISSSTVRCCLNVLNEVLDRHKYAELINKTAAGYVAFGSEQTVIVFAEF